MRSKQRSLIPSCAAWSWTSSWSTCPSLPDHGYSRGTFYRYKELYENGGKVALYEIYRKKPLLKNWVPEAVEPAVLRIAVQYTASGQPRAANRLRKEGIIIFPGGVRSVS